MRPTFQLAQRSDLDTVMQDMEAFHYFDHTEPFDYVSARTAITAIIDNRDIGNVWLIYKGEEVAGYVVMTISFRLECRGRIAFVDELYIRPEARRQGIGRATLAFLTTFCQDSGICQLQLEAEKENS